MAGVGIALSVSGVGLSGFVSIGAVFVAVVGIITAPWLATRSVRGATFCASIGFALVVVAAVLLSTEPRSNSDLWIPINLGRFGGVLCSELGLALTVHAAVLRRFGVGRALALALVNVFAIAIGATIAAWETRS